MSYYDSNGGVVLAVVYNSGQTTGVSILIAAACLSLVSVILVLTILGISAIRSFQSPQENVFIRTHVAAYFISLLICDLTQSIGSILNGHWIQNGGVTVGSFCTAQAVIKQAGNVGAALFSLVIAVHTFNVLFLRWHVKDYVCYGTLVCIWSLLGVVLTWGPAAIEDTKRFGPFYGIAGVWCWITSAYPTQRYTLEYMFMFTSAGLSFILYTLVFFRLRGNISVSGWKIYFHRRSADHTTTSSSHGSSKDKHIRTVARQMLWYPVAYTMLILPIAAARFSDFAGKKVPFEVTIFTASVFMLSGFVNAVLFTTTRNVIPASSIRSKWIPRRWISRGETSNSDAEYSGSYSTGTGKFTTTSESPTSPSAKAFPAFDSVPVLSSKGNRPQMSTYQTNSSAASVRTLVGQSATFSPKYDEGPRSITSPPYHDYDRPSHDYPEYSDFSAPPSRRPSDFTGGSPRAALPQLQTRQLSTDEGRATSAPRPHNVAAGRGLGDDMSVVDLTPVQAEPPRRQY